MSKADDARWLEAKRKMAMANNQVMIAMAAEREEAIVRYLEIPKEYRFQGLTRKDLEAWKESSDNPDAIPYWSDWEFTAAEVEGVITLSEQLQRAGTPWAEVEGMVEAEVDEEIEAVRKRIIRRWK